MQQITRAGQPIDVAGTLPVVGQAAPAMTLTNSDLEDVTASLGPKCPDHPNADLCDLVTMAIYYQREQQVAA